MKTIKFFLVFALAVLSTVSIAKPRIILGSNPYSMGPDVIVIQRLIMNANNISSYFQNTGIFYQNTGTSNTAGFEWPKGSGRTACFTSGLSIACGINGQYAMVMASYRGEYAPGHYKADYSWETNADFKMYTVKAGDNGSNNPDYANWYKIIPYGAPYKDMNNNHQFDIGIDIPGVPNSAQTIFECMGDGDVSQRNPGEGFGGGITYPLLGAEIHFTAWSYTLPVIADVQFMSWVVINKGPVRWDSTFMSVVVDPDLGDANDDYIGCDTVLNLGYCYNADNMDGNGSPPTYGSNPPVFGMDYFRSPVNKITGDTLGLSSFVYFTNTGSAPPPCEADPNGEPTSPYNMMQGMKKDRSPFMDVTQNPPKRTKFCYPGNPPGGGWTEFQGSMQNCNGDTTGPIIPVNPPGDRRFLLNSGALNFKVFPGDTQKIVVGSFVARGSTNLNGIPYLKALSRTAQWAYDSLSTVSVMNTGTEVPAKYNLFQNYPNPFNPSTKIKFSIVSSPHGLGGDLVQLKIYDIMGREVQTLVNERLQAGTYEATFDGSALNSGVYFYKLIANGHSETKKMLLLK